MLPNLNGTILEINTTKYGMQKLLSNEMYIYHTN